MIKKANLIRLISVVMVIALVVVIVVSMTKKQGSSKPMEEVAAPVATVFQNNLTTLGSDADFKKNFGLNAADYESVVYYVPTSNLYATEMLIIKMKNEAQGDDLEETVEARRASQSKIFEGYMSDQYALCENAIIDRNGNYLLFVVGENAEKVDKAFKDVLK